MTQRGAGWDFFVSYTQSDRAWAEWIAWTLEEDGHRVLVQAWDFVPGSNWVQAMQDGVIEAARTVAVLSSNYLRSVYGGVEWQAAWHADPQGRDRKLLTVRVSDCDRPGLLAGIVGIDLFGVDEVTAKKRLRSMVKRAVAGRVKPDEPPLFPGTDLPGARGTAQGDRAITREARFPGALSKSTASDGIEHSSEGGDIDIDIDIDIELDPDDLEKLQTFVTSAFPQQYQAEAILRRIGWPGPMPQFGPGYQAAWNEVFNEVRRGRIRHPYRKLLTYALDEYPANATLARLAVRYLADQ